MPEAVNPTLHEEKLRELILYISEKSKDDERFGKTKFFKLLAYSDFRAYQLLGEPITGARYDKYQQGPVAPAALVAFEVLQEQGDLFLDPRPYHGYTQHHYVNRRAARTEVFTAAELRIVDNMLELFANYGSKAIADQSHQDFLGWQMVGDREEIPYRTVLLSHDHREPSEETKRAGAAALARFAEASK